MKVYSSTVTLQEILNDITLRVYNQNKELTPSELLPLIQNEFSSCKFISVLADPYYDKQGNYITQEEKSLLKKLKPYQKLDLPQTMKCLVDMSIIPTNNPEIKEAKIPAKYGKILYELQQFKDKLLSKGYSEKEVKIKFSNMSFNELIKNSSFKENNFNYNKQYFLFFITDLKTYADHKIDKHGNRFPYYRTDWNKILTYPVQ